MGGSRITRWSHLVTVLAMLPLLAAGPSFALPDRDRTPGVVLTTDLPTICAPGYTKTVRPPASYTYSLKLVQMAEYGRAGNPTEYQEDHLIPLELGGAPRDPRNLWPQPMLEAHIKDRLEHLLHARACARHVPLAEAQTCIIIDWVTCWVNVGRP